MTQQQINRIRARRERADAWGGRVRIINGVRTVTRIELKQKQEAKDERD